MDVVTGWRTLELVQTPTGSIRLASYGDGSRWPTDQPLQAVCRKDPQPQHPAPNPDCRCGIYARLAIDDFVIAPDENRDPPFVGPCVFAQVQLTGRVLRYQTGYRAERAYPERLMIFCVECHLKGKGLRPAQWISRNPSTHHGLQAGCADHAQQALAPADAVLASLLNSYQTAQLDIS